MVGILIFTKKGVLDHKKKDGLKSEGRYCFWVTSKFPKKEVDKIYFAIKGEVKGFFKIHKLDRINSELHFYSESWTSLGGGVKLKPSQGWRYF